MLDELRARLEQELAVAIRRLRTLELVAAEPGEAPTAPASVFNDMDAIQFEESRETSVRARARLADRVKRLTAALARIDAGVYGRCVECGESIAEARLRALPDADTCLRCQEQLELARAAAE